MDKLLLELMRKQAALEKRLQRLEARGGYNIASSPQFTDLFLIDTAAGAVGPLLTMNNLGNAAADADRIAFQSNTSLRAYLEMVVRAGGAGYLNFATGPAGAPVVNFTMDENGNFTGTKFTVGTSYTPTWTGTGSNPSIGTGTLTGYYVRLGDLVIGWISMTAGGTTTFGTGTWEFAIPIAAATPPRFYVGACQVLDSGVADYVGISRLDQTTSKIRGIMSSGNSLGPAIPHAWGSGDVCVLSFAYRV